MKKFDIIFSVFVLLIAGVVALWYGIIGQQDAGQITITVENEVYGTYLLSTDQEIWIHDTNLLVIEDKKADMIDANCRNHDCVHQKSISKCTI